MMAMRQTSPRNDHGQLTSRLAHSPSDNHADLTSEPKMLIIFQAIEIERLTTEIDLLRGKLKGKEGKVLNAGSYEVQIRELMEKCNKLDDEKYSYREELAQAKDMNDQIFN